MSTNKVYGDGPNSIKLKELESRWEYDDPKFASGIPETFSIDQCKHSLFGASKVAADVMVQEYGRYFGMATCCLRGGCLTGPSHSGVELHGFLSYLVKCNLEEKTYNIFGYKGKQVRDNIHSEDVARFIECFLQAPRSGEVYNLGGGKANSCSILEAFQICEEFSGQKQKYEYLDENHICIGDHIYQKFIAQDHTNTERRMTSPIVLIDIKTTIGFEPSLKNQFLPLQLGSVEKRPFYITDYQFSRLI